MAGLYFHIPFCKQACHYCNFHFSTQLNHKSSVLEAMKKELELRAKDAPFTSLASIYFGGGSPSLVSPETLGSFLEFSKRYFSWESSIEITLEMNPDDVEEAYLKDLLIYGVNRISLGVQSFFDSDLKQMNRAHNAEQVWKALRLIQKYFTNYSLDLIYGIPGQTLADWKINVFNALEFEPPHISAYALTVEPKTVLAHQVAQKQIELLPEEEVKAQFDFLGTHLESLGYDHYESSNYGKPGFYSVNNTAYWQRKPYLGIGPSAHSYNGTDQRSWNVSNNHTYVKSLQDNRLAQDTEYLSQVDRYNETIMTGLRTQWGVSLEVIRESFGPTFETYLEDQAAKHLDLDYLFWDGDCLRVRKKAQFLVDGLAADLFLLNLDADES